MVKVKSREELLVITHQIEACTNFEQLRALIEEHGTGSKMLRVAFMHKIRQLDNPQKFVITL